MDGATDAILAQLRPILTNAQLLNLKCVINAHTVGRVPYGLSDNMKSILQHSAPIVVAKRPRTSGKSLPAELDAEIVNTDEGRLVRMQFGIPNLPQTCTVMTITQNPST